MSAASNRETLPWKGFFLSMLLLAVILGSLFHLSFASEQVLASNDGPLGALVAQAIRVPASFTGYWPDLYWVGANGGSTTVGITYFLMWLLGPLAFAKFYGSLTLLILGSCAWMFFRTLSLNTGLSLLGAIAAALNTNFFSNTCWGLGTRSLTLAAAFLALAALNAQRIGRPWLNAMLAGLAVGLGVIEGADNGVIFSLFIAAYVLFQSLATQFSLRRKLLACGRLVLVASFAAFLAAQALGSLVNLGIKDVPGARQDTETKARQWHFATQWSLPKSETLRVIIPGLFGYRMDNPNGREYWGAVGRYAPMPQAGWRSSGAGEYAGVLVVILGIWAFVQSLRRSQLNNNPPVFSSLERRHIWFWSVMLLVTVLLSWGRHAPFYRFFYELPFFSAMRNPMKFMHVGHLCLLILFGYGLLGLNRCYFQKISVPARGLKARWAKAPPFEKSWIIASLVAAMLSFLALLIYSAARPNLIRYLGTVGFEDPAQAASIAHFSAHEVSLFCVFLVLSLGILALAHMRYFSGNRAQWAIIALGSLLTIDLARADVPWIRYDNIDERYATHPLLDVLREKPYLNRVSVFPVSLSPNSRHLQILDQLYRAEWLQYQFPYYGIQALDMPQEPRPPAYKTNYLKAVTQAGVRLWELTNTRYLLGVAGLDQALNQQLDPVQHGFQTKMHFNLVQAGNTIATVTNDRGPWALIEFTGALPRASLYTHWQVITNDEATLAQLGSPSFNPSQTVLINENIPLPSPGAGAAETGIVEFISYAPKHIELKVHAKAPSVLLQNDRWDPGWQVLVDDQPAQLLRCNAIMRGVQVRSGDHKITWRFQPPLTLLKITCAAWAIGIALCGLLVIMPSSEPTPCSETSPRANESSCKAKKTKDCLYP